MKPAKRLKCGAFFLTHEKGKPIIWQVIREHDTDDKGEKINSRRE